MKNKRYIFFGIIISLGLFFFFLFLQEIDSKFLELETKWLIVSGIPILIALIIGGYITKFKGFGIELETLLQNPIDRVDLVALDAVEELNGEDKRSLEYLENLSKQAKGRIQRLSFNIDKRRYYISDIVIEYLRELKNLKFIELKSIKGAFLGLFPVENLKEANKVDLKKINEFINSLSEGNFLNKFKDDIIQDKIKDTDSLIDVLPRLRESKLDILPVVTKGNRFLGIITTEMVEKKIADMVIVAHKKS